MKENFDFIDVHTHCMPFPYRSFARFASSLKFQKFVGKFVPDRMDENSVSIVLSLSYGGIDFDSYVKKIIEGKDNLYGFLAHPENFEEEILGMKFHNCFKNHSREELERRFDFLSENEKAATFHLSNSLKDFERVERTIQDYRDLFSSYPKVKVIIPHMVFIEELIDLENVYFDTAFVEKGEVKEKIGEYGNEKFLFGTDYPVFDQRKRLNKLKEVLSEKDLNKIAKENPKRVLFS